MRQYRVLTKTPETNWVQLEPNVHGGLYNIPEIRSAIEYLKSAISVEMIGIRINSRVYTIIVTHEDELQPNQFELPENNDV